MEGLITAVCALPLVVCALVVLGAVMTAGGDDNDS